MVTYEKGMLEKALEDTRIKIEERVPVLVEVEKRRVELESDLYEKAKELRTL
jgi:hypothetical protein